jgi:hypothetical protein
VPRQHRAARLAIAALFLTNGAVFANLLPRYPQIKADLGLSNAEYGLAIAGRSSTRSTPSVTPGADGKPMDGESWGGEADTPT